MRTILVRALVLLLASMLHSETCADGVPPDLWPIAKEKDFGQAGTLSSQAGTKTYFLGRRTSATGASKRNPIEILEYDTRSDEVTPVLDAKDSERLLGCESMPHENCFRVSPSGRYLAVGIPKWQPDKTDIALVDTTSKTATVVVSDGLDNRGYFFSPDDHYLLYYAHPADSEFRAQAGEAVETCAVKIVDLSTRNTKTILPMPEGKVGGFQRDEKVAWSPDGHAVVFYVLRPRVSGGGGGPSVYEYDVDSGKSRLLTSHDFSIKVLAFSDSARVLVGSENKIESISLSDGKTRPLAQERGMRNFRFSNGKISYQTGVGAQIATREVAIPSE